MLNARTNIVNLILFNEHEECNISSSLNYEQINRITILNVRIRRKTEKKYAGVQSVLCSESNKNTHTYQLHSYDSCRLFSIFSVFFISPIRSYTVHMKPLKPHKRGKISENAERVAIEEEGEEKIIILLSC